MNLDQLWFEFLKEMESRVSHANFSTWFKQTKLPKVEDGTAYMEVPDTFTQDWIKKKFHNDILQILKSFDDSIKSVEYVTQKDRSEHGYSETVPDKLDFVKGEIISRIDKLHGSIGNTSGRIGQLETRIINMTSKLDILFEKLVK